MGGLPPRRRRRAAAGGAGGGPKRNRKRRGPLLASSHPGGSASFWRPPPATAAPPPRPPRASLEPAGVAGAVVEVVHRLANRIPYGQRRQRRGGRRRGGRPRAGTPMIHRPRDGAVHGGPVIPRARRAPSGGVGKERPRKERRDRPTTGSRRSLPCIRGLLRRLFFFFFSLLCSFFFFFFFRVCSLLFRPFFIRV